MSAAVRITLWTDPACPFAFSAEPVRMRLRWLYGDGLSWRPRMIVLTREDGHAERLAGGGAGLQARYGMPISAWPYPRPASCEPACLAVVAARELGGSPQVAERLLRALRVRTMAGGLLDEPALMDGAAADAGLEPATLRAWMQDPVALEALEADAAGARDPSPRARALDHKLGGPAHERRYTAPSYELECADQVGDLDLHASHRDLQVGDLDLHASHRDLQVGDLDLHASHRDLQVGDLDLHASHKDLRSRAIAVPGFNPADVYETAIANLAPSLPRRDPPESVAGLLRWSDVPLATAEVVEIMRRPEQELRDALARDAVPIPAGADMYWSLPGPA